MEAYNDSLEASQNRVTAAIEKITLDVNGSGVLIEINNLIAKLIDNIGVLTATVLTLGVVFNKKALFDVGTKGLAALGTKIMSVGTMFSNFSNIIDKTKWSEIGETINQTYDAQQAGKYNESLLDYANKHKLESTPIANLTGFQNKMLGEDRNYQNHIGEFLSLGLDSKDTKFSDSFETFKKSMDATAVELAVDSLKTKELAGVKAEQIVDIKKATINSQELTNVTVEQKAAIKAAVAAERERANALIQDTETIVTGNGANVQPIGENLKSNAKRGSGTRQVGIGVASIAGMIGGSAGGSDIASFLGLGETGEMIGSILGGVAGTEMASTIAGSFTGTFSSLFTASTTLPWVGTILLGLGIVWKAIDAYNEKKLKEAQEKFQKAAERYTSAFNASADISRYSELVAGVDSLGNNVSLTNDDYQEFLDISNSLADAFPSLITRTDDAGNSFVGMGGKVSDVTDKVNELTRTLQHNADVALLEPIVLKNSLSKASKQYSDAKKELEQLSTYDGQSKYWEKVGVRYDISLSTGKKEYNQEDIKDFGNKAVIDRRKELKQEMNEATQSLSDEAQAKVRETLGDSFYDLDDASIQAIYTATSGIAPNSENWEDNIKDITQGMQKFLSENPEMIEFYYADNSSMSSEEYQKSREEMYNTLKSYFPTMTDDDIIKILYAFQYDGDNDLTNSMQKISSEGLDSKIDLNGKNFNEVFGKDFNVTQMANAYELLSAASDDAKFSVEQFKKAVYNKSYGDMGLTQLATQYKNFKKVFDEGEITDNESKQWDIVKGKLDLYAKELGVASGEYDKIINKIKIIGDLTWGGTSIKTPEQVIQDNEDYKKIYEYLKNDYNGTWDAEIHSMASTKEELIPYLNDPKAMKAQVKKLLDNVDIAYTESMQARVIATKEGTDAILDKESDRVNKFKEKYGIDLSNFETLQAAEQAVQLMSTDMMTDNMDTWVFNMEQYYEEDLSKFSDKWSKKLAMARMVMDEIGRASEIESYADLVDSGQMTEEQAAEASLKWAYDQTNGALKKDYFAEAQADFQELLNSGIGSFETDAGAGDSKIDKGKTAVDVAEAKLALVDKEYEAMKALGRAKNLEEGRDTNYYKLEREALLNKKAALQTAIGTDKTEAERLGHLKDIQDVEKEIRNLDDEELADKESWAETLGNSLDRMKQIYEAQLKAADTYEEVIQAQKKLNDLLSEEYEDRVRIANSVIDTAKRNQSYFAPDTKEYSNYTRIISAQYKQIAKEAKAELQRQLDRLIEVRMGEVNSKTGKKYNRAEATEWAKMQTEYLDAENAYYEANQNVVQTALDTTEAKVQKIQNAIDKLENAKPQEWTSVNDIANYTNQLISGLTNQIVLYKETLASSLVLEDEQIEDLNKKINDNLKSIQNAKIQQQQDIVNLKTKTYEAFTWQVNKYIDSLTEYKATVDKAYDNEIQKLRDINDSKERTIKLTELLQNLENANKEGKRVFRAGIGWVYEQDRSGIKKAQQELNSFYEEDRISDLQNTKDSEDKILDERIENWNNYLKSIEDAYNKYEDEVKKHLLFEEFNVDSQEKLFDKLYNDMTQNVVRLDSNLDDYTGVMNGFLGEYTQALNELTKLKQQWLDAMNIDFNLPTIDGGMNFNKGDFGSLTGPNADYDLSDFDFSGIEDSKKWTKTASGEYYLNADSGVKISVSSLANTDWSEKAASAKTLDELQDILEKRALKAQITGINLGDDKHSSNLDLWNQYAGNMNVGWIDSTGKEHNGTYSEYKKWYGDAKEEWLKKKALNDSKHYATSDDVDGYDDMSDSQQKIIDDAIDYSNEGYDEGWYYDENGEKRDRDTDKVLGYSNGIKQGTVTYTGLAMLHGTPQSPEWVLNNSQMYNFVRNMSTLKTPAFSRNVGEAQGSNYNFYGDIDLPNVKDPSNFFSELMNATDNRISVTKNKL